MNHTKCFCYIILSVFFIAFCDRVYSIAPTYVYSKILMSFGARLEGLFYLFIVAFVIPVKWVGLKLVAKIFLAWRCFGFMFFCYIQFTADHVFKEALWNNGFSGSGAMAKSIFLATAQESFVLAVPVVTFYLLWLKSQSVRGTYDIYNE